MAHYHHHYHLLNVTGYRLPIHPVVEEAQRRERETASKTPRVHTPNKEAFLYSQTRQYGSLHVHPESIVSSYVSRQLPGLLKEREYDLGQINKIFAASWVSDRQVVFGTKCNKLIVMDLITKQMAQIPSMRSSEESVPAQCPCGIHAIATNPSKTLLATGADNTNDVAIYKLPTFDPVCVGEGGHDDWIFDIKWLDDQFLVTGSRDSKMCLWRVADEDGPPGEHSVSRAKCLQLPEYEITRPLAIKMCKRAEKVRALAYNTRNQELAALSLNACVHIWDAQKFVQKSTIRLKQNRENVCMCIRQDSGVYAVGSQSHITLVDPRAPKANPAPIPSMQRGCGIRSVNFNADILSIGTGAGCLYFYDMRANKYLDMSCGHPLSLTAGKGWLLRDETYREFFPDMLYPNAIYAHCYDDSSTRLFVAGGPLPAGLYGNYAALWH